jgi:xylulokinase
MIHILCDAVRESDINPNHVAGIDFAGQIHGLVCLDEDRELLWPAIIWADQRSKMQITQLQDRFGLEQLAR